MAVSTQQSRQTKKIYKKSNSSDDWHNLTEKEKDQKWDELLSKPCPAIDQMEQEAIEEFERGETIPLP